MSNKQWTEDEVTKLLSLINNLNIASFSAPVSSNPEDKQTELGEFILDTKPGPQELLELSDRTRILNAAVQHLDPREQHIIQLRYGLKDGKFKTLDEIGNMYGVTRERIRQVEMKAIKKLKWILVRKYKFKREDL